MLIKLPWLFPQFSPRSGPCKALKAPSDPACILHGPQRDLTTLMGLWSPPIFSQFHRAGTASALEFALNSETSRTGFSSFHHQRLFQHLQDAGGCAEEKRCAEGGETRWSILFIPKTKPCSPSQVTPNQLLTSCSLVIPGWALPCIEPGNNNTDNTTGIEKLTGCP